MSASRYLTPERLALQAATRRFAMEEVLPVADELDPAHADIPDRLLRRIIAGLPEYLEDQGTFHILTIGMDLQGALFEQRAREWLGRSSDDFDVVFALGSTKSA